MKMIITVFFGVFFISSIAFPVNSPKYLEFNQGMNLVKKEGKPMFVFVYATWCSACRKMEKDTLSNAKIIQFLEKFFVVSRMNADEQELEVNYDGKKYLSGEFLSALQIRGIPSYIFIDKTGKVIGVIPGVFPPDLFYNVLNYIKDACYLKKVSLEKFVENPKKCEKP